MPHCYAYQCCDFRFSFGTFGLSVDQKMTESPKIPKVGVYFRYFRSILNFSPNFGQKWPKVATFGRFKKKLHSVLLDSPPSVFTYGAVMEDSPVQKSGEWRTANESEWSPNARRIPPPKKANARRIPPSKSERTANPPSKKRLHGETPLQKVNPRRIPL